MNITVAGLTVARQAQTVLKDIDLDLPSGQIVGLLGPNGSGKSTLLRCLAGLFPRHSERVALNGTTLGLMPLKIRAQHMAFVPQHAEVDGELTVEDIVRLGRTPYRKTFQRTTRDDEAAVEQAIGLMQLCSLRQRRWHSLSGGERQRSQIARALAQQPQVLLLDEPTNHLDIQHQLELMRLVSQLPLTVVVALHDLNLAANYCQRLILLKAGQIAATGAPEAVLTPSNIADTWCVKAQVCKADAGITISFNMGNMAESQNKSKNPCDIAIAGVLNLAEA
ncbi:ABC transporter ATP-binding protein [Enterobacter hormaechei]|uniref:ABC transporter ATP-binding protein n=1 Tax=Enterobacter hormaechei TaxID=158836 RepID=UPI001F13432D|nr:ABC transporter ATP-binding protein [Enterobacter hormaechei]MDS0075475.1 ABC transporter ATP-binding protein [Enterobacter hormaechei subsp. hoffmannii]WBM55842.1 ABC transporter ATP-binding protein [Enterobacter hormaechei]